jgi:hypothetical protein
MGTEWQEKKGGKPISGRKNKNKKRVRLPGIEPGSKAWKASMLTITPQTHVLVLTRKSDNK